MLCARAEWQRDTPVTLARDLDMNTITVAMAQQAFLLDDVARNIQTADRVCGDAAKRGARLVVFPEAALTGSLRYLPEGTDLHGHAVALPGPETDRIAETELGRRAEAYRGQLKLYASAAEGILERPVVAKWLYFLTPAQAVEV